jgi:hypothetical protein
MLEPRDALWLDDEVARLKVCCTIQGFPARGLANYSAKENAPTFLVACTADGRRFIMI